MDIRPLACGHFICLHDAQLEEETTGRGLVAGAEASAIPLLEMPGADNDLAAAIMVGCDQITTNTANAWAAAKLGEGRASEA